jgi:hypothetical protein
VILESIVTSVDLRGQINLAPMGPRVDPQLLTRDAEGALLVLRPFDSSRTYRNLIETGKAVVHVTDDAELMARAAVDAIHSGEIESLVHRIDDTQWWALRDCHRWLAVTVESVSDQTPRVDLRCRVVRSGLVRPFFGFNRAKHAVIEAAIVATRCDWLPAGEIREQLERLQPLVDKTGGPAEHRAFDFLRKTIDARLAQR